jgi:hypothetical protein
MKKLSCVLLVLFSLSFFACSSDDASSDNNTNNPEEALYLKFTRNGVQYDFEPETLTSLQILVRGDQEVAGVYSSISLWMPKTPSVGSYPITDAFPNEFNITTLYNANVWVGDEIVDASSGTIVITEVGDNYVEGTFNFSGTNNNETTAIVTDGSFRALK